MFDKLFNLLGALLLVAAVVGGLFVALYLMLYGGIVQVVDGVTADPVDSTDIALGVVRIIFFETAGAVTFFILFFASLFSFALGGTQVTRRRIR